MLAITKLNGHHGYKEVHAGLGDGQRLTCLYELKLAAMLDCQLRTGSFAPRKSMVSHLFQTWLGCLGNGRKRLSGKRED